MKLDKPFAPEEEDIDLLLNEIPNATSALPHTLLHHPFRVVPPYPVRGPHTLMHAVMTSPTDVSPLPSPPPPPPPSVVNELELLARFQAMQLRNPDPNPLLYPNPNPYPSPNPYPHQLAFHPALRYSQELLARSANRNLARPANPNPNPLRGSSHYEDSFILEGRRINHNMNEMGMGMGIHNKKRDSGLTGLMKLESVAETEEYMYMIAKDQNGCRVLQKKLEEGRRQDVDLIFNGVISHVAELMMNPFGNYLMQKLLDVCNEEQRLRVVLELTRDPWEIIRVSLNTHGTRAVQRLIETLNTPQQIGLVVSALKPGFLSLIKDLNGNHVIQRCLQSLSAENNKFIFEAAARHCVDIGTHRHGCCVLQKCIKYAIGDYQIHLIEEISAHGLHLAQDAFGNYVVQFILEKNYPSGIANLARQFKGNYVQLSTQKFSSNVVEKCLKYFGESDLERIVFELLSFTRFEMLLQDPFANYVIQSALAVTKGSLHAALVKAILPHAASLRSSPYCKRIFSRTQSRR